MSDLPRRRIHLTMVIGADSWDQLRQGLDQIAFDFARDRGPEPISIASGSPGVGYTIEGTVNEAQTAEGYRSDLLAWTERRRAQAAEQHDDDRKVWGGEDDGW